MTVEEYRKNIQNVGIVNAAENLINTVMLRKNLILTSKGHNTIAKRLNGNVCRCVALMVPVTAETADDDLPFN